LTLLLTITLVATNFVVTTERTVLSPQFVGDTLEEESFYGDIQKTAVENVTEQVSPLGETFPLTVSVEQLVDESLTEAYIESQVESNLDRLHAYLHGESGRPNLYVNTSPVKENLKDEVDAEVKSSSMSELLEELPSDAFAFDVAGFTFSLSTLEKMAGSQQGYEEVRASFRDAFREEVESSLGVSPSEDQLDSLIEQRMEEMRSQVRQTVEESTEGIPSEMSEPLIEMAMTGLDGLATDRSHEEFKSELDASKADLASGIRTVLDRRLDEEIPDRVGISSEMGPSELSALDRLRQAVGFLDLALWLLPVTAAAIIGAGYLVTRSVPLTAEGAGAALFVSGLTGIGFGRFFIRQLEAGLAEAGGPPLIKNAVIELTDGTLTVLTQQSVALLAVGVLVFLAGYAARRDMLEGLTSGGTD